MTHNFHKFFRLVILTVIAVSIVTPSMAKAERLREYTDTRVSDKVKASALAHDYYYGHHSMDISDFLLDVINKSGFTMAYVKLTSTCVYVPREKEREEAADNYMESTPPPTLPAEFAAWRAGLEAAIAPYPPITITESHKNENNVDNYDGYKFADVPWVSSWRVPRNVHPPGDNTHNFECRNHTIKVGAQAGGSNSVDFGLDVENIKVQGTTGNVKLTVYTKNL